MSWWTRQRLGVILLMYFVSIRHVCSLNNTTDADKLPETHSKNQLLDSLLRDCKTPTLTCLQKSLYGHLEKVLMDTDNFEVKGFFRVEKNNASVELSPNDSISKSYEIGDKVRRFILTHNVQLQMPEYLFGDTVLEIAPRNFEASGLIAKLRFLPKTLKRELGRPRIFFKKIKKFVGEKLMHALLAIILVVALLAIKFLFFMPLVIGVAAAKKILLKILLFFFPFLSYVFKLCPYVQDHNGLTKFHHHHHQIAHLHHVPPYHHDASNHPPEHHHQEYDTGLEYYGGGPDVSASFLHRKKDPPRTVIGDRNELHSWGMQGKNGNKKPSMNRPLTPAEIEALTAKAEKEAVLQVRLQQEHKRVHSENQLLQEKIQQSLKLQEQLKNKMANLQRYPNRNSIQQPSIDAVALALQGTQPTNLTRKSPPDAPPPPIHQSPVPVGNDPFYTPILDKIDKVLTSIGFVEESCKERILCSMYKNPTKFSPHSNLVSAQLSRDSSELQKPTSTNAAVVRFYRYVQAARDGQDKRDCLRLYPACSINTEL